MMTSAPWHPAPATGAVAGAPSRPADRLDRVQALRFLAAFAVLVGHALHAASVASGRSGSEALGLPGLRAAHYAAGVDLFFVISGFIMYHVGRAGFGQPGAAGRFLLRRAIRIVPAYWVFTTAMLLVVLTRGSAAPRAEVDALHVLMSYLFIPWPDGGGEPFPLLKLGWTLNFEVFFYAVFALGLALGGARSGPALVFGVILLASAGGTWLGVQQLPLALWCSPLALEFLMGMALAMLYARGLRLHWVASAGLLALGLLLLFGGGLLAPPEVYWPMRWLYMGLPAALVAAALVLCDTAPLRTPALLRWGGDASYALYLSHPFSLGALGLLAPRLGVADPWWVFALAVTMALLVAAAFHAVVERPLTEALRARWGG